MELRELIGARYTPHGRTVAEGLDCYGVAMIVLGMAGVHLPDVFYGDTDAATNRRILESLEASVPNTKLASPEKNCIIEFNILGQPSHIGVYLGDGEFIHASRQFGVAIDKLYRWKSRVRGYYRVNN
jgi:cell wall-associated NlpC family hydrolase